MKLLDADLPCYFQIIVSTCSHPLAPALTAYARRRLDHAPYQMLHTRLHVAAELAREVQAFSRTASDEDQPASHHAPTHPPLKTVVPSAWREPGTRTTLRLTHCTRHKIVNGIRPRGGGSLCAYAGRV